MQQIQTQDELIDFARRYKLRPDWHEPDNNGISARIIGTHLDNAFGSTAVRYKASDGYEFGEYNVILSHDEQDVAVVNLATLFGFATGYEG